MSRGRFLIETAFVALGYIGLTLIATLLFTDAADYLHEWGPAEKDIHWRSLALASSAVASPLLAWVLDRRLKILGWPRWLALAVLALFILRAWWNWGWIPFLAAYAALVIGRASVRTV